MNTEIKKYHCNYCGKSYMKNSKLNSHIENVHCVYNEKRQQEYIGHVCAFCKNIFEYESGLDKHMKTHIEENPFSCGECNKSFKTQKKLEKHFKKQHEVDIPFLSHTKFITNENVEKSTQKLNPCGECNKSFKTKEKLEKHIRKKLHFKP